LLAPTIPSLGYQGTLRHTVADSCFTELTSTRLCNTVNDLSKVNTIELYGPASYSGEQNKTKLN
jgi:hypothetical protein